MKTKNLKLNAISEEDLKIISAHLQDAITQVKDIAFLKKNRILLIQFNRFMWEDVEKGIFRKSKRVQSVLKFGNILRVYSQNLNQKKNDRFLDFLAIENKLMSDKSYEIKLNFAGNILIKMKAEVIECFLEDLGNAWETKNKPKHNFLDD